MPRPVLILQTGDVPAGVKADGNLENFDRMFLAAADYGRREIEVIQAQKEPLPIDAAKYGGVIITGSPSMVTDREDWSEKSAAWLREAITRGVPVLGVCYGHQLVAHALGGVVGWHPKGMELGTHTVALNASAARHPLLCGLPTAFPANLAHSQSVLIPPPGARILASSAHEPHQILAYGEQVLTLQFHPEFTGRIMEVYVNYLTATRNRKAGRAVNAGLPVQDTPKAREVLQRFVAALKKN